MNSRWMTVGLLAGGVGSLLAVNAADAAIISLSALKDNTLYQDTNGALSNGAGEFVFAGNTAQNVTRRGLIAFDIAGNLPAGATINSVSLTLHMSMSSAGSQNVALHSVLANWGEGTSDAPGGEGPGTAATTGDATWIHTFFNTSFWTNAGGDFNTVASATLNVGAVNFYTWSSAPMTADVQSWLSNPAANFGWLLKGNEAAANSSKRFDTRENADTTFRPVLLIDYTLVPAPGAALGLGMIALLPRRRRES